MTERSIVAVGVPGDGMLRFCSVEAGDFGTDDWVVVRGPLGHEPGLVLFGTEDVDAAPSSNLRYSIERRLVDEEVSQIDARVQLARALTGAVTDHVSAIDVALEMISVRLSLDDEMILCAISGRTDVDPAHIERHLEERLGRPVRIELMDGPAVIYGSVGKLRGRQSAGDRSVLDRVGVGRLSGNPRPNGWPRLGSRVTASGESGVLIGISVRHDAAIIRFDHGDEREMPLDEITVVTS